MVSQANLTDLRIKADKPIKQSSFGKGSVVRKTIEGSEDAGAALGYYRRS